MQTAPRQLFSSTPRQLMPLDDLLDISCQKLQLPQTLFDQAEQHYHAIGKWLADPSSPLAPAGPVIYPQGSVRTGTTTKPVGRNEYDLDLVCEMALDWRRVHAMLVLDAVEARLRHHETYRTMVERKNRCVRLRYADRFHLDILPAVSDGSQTSRVLVPDCAQEGWKPSNPKGYAHWFERRGIITDKLVKAHVELLPAFQSAGDKTPLQRAVQLLKRARDTYFLRNPDDGPRSIVLTTLAAEVYGGQRSTAIAFSGIVNGIAAKVQSSGGHIRVVNPTNSAELLSEQWERTPQTFAHFVQWLSWVADVWGRVVNGRGGLHGLQAGMAALFGEPLAKAALKAHAEQTDELRKSGTLGVTRTGLITVGAGVAVRPNTFHGG
jgi:hypothetical protein